MLNELFKKLLDFIFAKKATSHISIDSGGGKVKAKKIKIDNSSKTEYKFVSNTTPIDKDDITNQQQVIQLKRTHLRYNMTIGFFLFSALSFPAAFMFLFKFGVSDHNLWVYVIGLMITIIAFNKCKALIELIYSKIIMASRWQEFIILFCNINTYDDHLMMKAVTGLFLSIGLAVSNYHLIRLVFQLI